MAANRKRTPFNPAGPFIARKNFSMFDADLKVGSSYEAAVFARLHARRLEQLFDANYIDMAPADAKVLTDDQVLAAGPLDRDGDGMPGGSLTDAEEAALVASGTTLEAWLQLPTPERVTALAAALAAAPVEPVSGDTDDTGGQGDGEQADSGPETGAVGDAGAGGGEGATEAPEGAVGPAVAIRSLGFGRWCRVDAAGNRLETPFVGTKSNATALAAAERLGLQNKDGEPL